MVKWIKRHFGKALQKVGSKIGMNEAGSAGIVATLANNIPTFQMMKDMNPKGKLINVSFAVSQVTSVSGSELTTLKDNMIPYMERLLPNAGLDMLFLMLTNIMEETTELLFVGSSAAEVFRTAFCCADVQKTTVYLPDVVSRKKQMVAPIISAIEDAESA